MADNNGPFAAAGLLIALGLGVGGWLIGDGFRDARQGDRFVTVRGAVEREVKADMAVWPLSFATTGNDLAQAQQKVAADEAAVREFLTGNGVPAAAIETQGLEVNDLFAQVWRSGPVENRFILTQRLIVRSADVDLIAGLASRISELVARGVILGGGQDGQSAGPNFVFTKLNDIKPAMIAEATKSARQGAEEFARDSGAKVGGIRRASQGVFQILPRDEVPGLMENRQIMKTVRVVATLDYSLVD
jgi:hypothetical protein